MKEITCKLLIIGAGPGGYTCAIRAGQLGVDTVIVEAEKPGGACLNVGCIPSKALIHAGETYHDVCQMAASSGPLGINVRDPGLDLARTIAWKDGIVARLNSGVLALMAKARVKVVHGRARFRDGKTVEVETETGIQAIHAQAVVIATGAEPVDLPGLAFGGSVISSTEALSLTAVPDKLVVVGAGYIGMELGTAFAKMGSQVTFVEAKEQILPQYDSDLVAPVARRLAALGVRILTRAKAMGLSDNGLLIEDIAGTPHALAADKILVAVGRRPRTDVSGLGDLDLDHAGPFLRIDEHCRTSMRGVFAIGDITGEPMLAHRAMAQGELVAEIVAGKRRAWDKRCIPAVCFTDPEIVAVGLSPKEARAQGFDIRVGQFPFSANGRAMTTSRDDGFVRVVARADSNLVLGVQAVGLAVSELSAAFSLAIEMGARLEDIAATIHAHPTRSEGFQEAAMKALGHALHI